MVVPSTRNEVGDECDAELLNRGCRYGARRKNWAWPSETQGGVEMLSVPRKAKMPKEPNCSDDSEGRKELACAVCGV